MTDSKTQKAKYVQQSNLCDTLTEQWKKGELPEGFYWIEFQDGEITPTTFSNQHGFICCDAICDEEKIKQILAEMPSYEEWQELKASYEMSKDANLEQATWMVDMEKENTKLKELLKECNLAIFDYPPYDLASDKIRLQNKINQVLGEE